MILSDDHAPGEPGRPPFESVFERVEPAPKGIPIWRAGVYDEPVHTYYLYRCYGYRRMQASLTKQCVNISEKVVQRLMKQE